MKKIVKFGGSSLANAEQFQKVGEIITSDDLTLQSSRVAKLFPRTSA